MGYTHYWKIEQKPAKQEWERFTDTCREIFHTAVKDGIQIQYESDQERAPEASSDRVRFNGKGAEGHETFYIEPEVEAFEFCKTARKPYDTVVVAVLMAAEALLPGFEWSSDGDGQDFEAGRELALKALGIAA